MRPFIRILSSLFGDEELKGISRNSSPLFFSGLVVTAISFLQTVVTARFLGVFSYGILALVVAYVSMVNQVVDCRVREAAVKYLSEFWAARDNKRVWATAIFCYLVDLMTGIAAFLLVTATAPLIAKHLIRQPEAVFLIRAYGLTLLFATMNGTSQGILSVFGGFSLWARQSIIVAASQCLFVVLFLFLGFHLAGVFGGYILASLGGSFFLYALARRVLAARMEEAAVDLRFFKSFFVERAGGMAKFLFWTNVNELTALFTRNLDVLLLGYFRAPTEVGFFRMAKNFVSLSDLVGGPLSLAIYPRIAGLWHRGRRREFLDLLKRFSRLMAIVSVPAAVAAAIAIPWVIRWTIGATFLPAAEAVRIMMAGSVISVVFLWVRPSFLSIGRPGILAGINVFSSLTMSVLLLMVVPRYGYRGAAWCTIYPVLVGHVFALLSFRCLMKKDR